MPYSITTKDGITIQNIPDDVKSDSQVLKDRVAAIRAGGGKQPAKPERTAIEETGRALGLTARYGIEGAASGAGAFVDPVIEALGGAVRAVTGKDYDPATLTGLGQMISNTLGLPEAETSGERVVGALTRGVAGGLGGARAAATVAANSTGITQRAAQSLAQGPALQAVAGGSGGLAGQVIAENGGSAGEQLAGSLVAGILTPTVGSAGVRAVRSARAPVQPTTPVIPQALPSDELATVARQAVEGGLGSKSATRVLAEQSMPDQRTIDAAKRLGIAEHLQPDHVTTSQAFRELAQAVKSVPGSTTRMAELEGLEAVAKKADDLVEQFGGTRDFSTLDRNLKQTMQSTQEQLEQEANKLYGELRTAIPSRAPASAPSVLSFIDSRAADLGGVKNLSPMEKMIVVKLSPKTVRAKESVAGDPLMPGASRTRNTTVSREEQPTYALVDDVRRDLTAARIQRAGPFKDADSGLIKKLEAELRKDQRAAIEPYGQLDKFDAAQKVVAVRKGLEDDMAAIFGKQLDGSIVGDLKGALKVLPQGDVSKMTNLLRSIPENMRQQVVASGLSSAFNISAKNQNLSFTNYANWYEGLLKNRRAYAALMSNLPPEARKQMSDLYRVSRGISKATKERITTGRIQSVKEELVGPDNLMANIYSVAKRASAGLAVEAITTPLGVPGAGISAGIASALTKGKPDNMKAADKLISSPEFMRAIRNSGNPQAAQQLAASRAFKEFWRGLKQPQNDPAQWIRNAFVAGSADQIEVPPEQPVADEVETQTPQS